MVDGATWAVAAAVAADAAASVRVVSVAAVAVTAPAASAAAIVNAARFASMMSWCAANRVQNGPPRLGPNAQSARSA